MNISLKINASGIILTSFSKESYMIYRCRYNSLVWDTRGSFASPRQPPPLSPKSLINHSPQAVFFRKSVPFSGKEGNCGKNIKNINLKNKLFANVLRKICGRQSLPPSSIICIIYRWLLAYWTGHFMESNVFILTSN